MRFHTKEWRRLMMNVGLSSTIKKIPDGHYSDEEIQKLYDEKAKERPAIENFPQNYECNIVGCVNIFPQWLLDEVDHRLIAMEYFARDSI